MRRTVRLSGILLAVLLPVSVALQTGPMSSGPASAGERDRSAGPTKQHTGVRRNPRHRRTPVKRPADATPSIPNQESPSQSAPPGSPHPTPAAALVRKTLPEYERAVEALDYEGVRRVWPLSTRRPAQQLPDLAFALRGSGLRRPRPLRAIPRRFPAKNRFAPSGRKASRFPSQQTPRCSPCVATAIDGRF
jgi:hypothetical protein